jgi:hypothetical protein
MFVEIDPVFVQRPTEAGRVGAIEARQLLRAAAVGGLPDARLELNVYDLLRRHGVGPGPWIGETIGLADRPPLPTVDPAALEDRPARRAFEAAGREQSTGFLQVRAASFREVDRHGNTVSERALEYVTPRPLSGDTVAVALLRRAGDAIHIGVDDADLPAAQCIAGNSELLVAPAWRLPHDIRSLTPARAWILQRLRDELGVEVGDAWWLGGRYHPSPGATVEVVHPLAVDVASVSPGARPLHFIALPALLRAPAILSDGHLRVVAERSAHALSC